MDLDEVADRLYGVPPPEFTAARAEAARAAKEAGDAGLAKEIAKLGKPTVSAWAVNRLSREHSAELDELLEVGERLRAAWQEQDADELAELTRLRGEVSAKVGRLARQAGDLSAAAATEVDQTLDAALVDEEAAAEVRRGRLAKPLRYSGFAPAPVTRPRPSRAKKKGAAEEADETGEAGEAAEARRREEEAARKVKEREEAEAAHREWLATLESAQREYDERAEKVERLEKKLAKARKKLDDARQRLEVTKREERHARQRLER
ncbi:hypothetical protein [Nonomuraea salmonea]|uniref:Transposase n=1 Tax=Nonomuraea salmonea TaxID=46181 RepID=A0ABV5NUI7_9ACTN